MAATELTPYLNELLKSTGILYKTFEKNIGTPMQMYDHLQTNQDRMAPPVYGGLKMALICTLVGAFVDQKFPTLAQEKGQEFRGTIVIRLTVEIYRLLTDGVSIDVLRHVVGEPNPIPTEKMS